MDFMQLADIISALSEPQAYPYEVTDIRICQTHISVVFLAGDFVYKMKKPVQLGFLDFSTPEKREHYCHEEIRLNRRLAPHVYLSVVPISQTETGIRVEQEGTVLEWAVKMVRLPDEATLEQFLIRSEVDDAQIQRLAGLIADFHAQAETNDTIADYGKYETVAGNALENFEQTHHQVGKLVSKDVFEQIQSYTNSILAENRELINKRASEHKVCDTHGDLRLDHVYFFPDKPEPDDIVILDCIEFNERFRYADPVADMAFLVMDLKYHGYRQSALCFSEAYFRATADMQGQKLLPFYTAYRAVVRAKVEGIKATESEVAEEDRERAGILAKTHWLLALAELAPVKRIPCLLLIGGPPGSGKSTLAEALSAQANFTVLRTDVIRKELAGVSETTDLNTFSENLYSEEWNNKTYSECCRRAEDLLFQGQRVIIDASFREEVNRERFLKLGVLWSVPVHLLMCQVSEDVARQRILGRTNDASDADFAIFLKAIASWEQPGVYTQQFLQTLDVDGSPDDVLQQTLAWLERVGLFTAED